MSFSRRSKLTSGDNFSTKKRIRSISTVSNQCSLEECNEEFQFGVEKLDEDPDPYRILRITDLPQGDFQPPEPLLSTISVFVKRSKYEELPMVENEKPQKLTREAKVTKREALPVHSSPHRIGSRVSESLQRFYEPNTFESNHNDRMRNLQGKSLQNWTTHWSRRSQQQTRLMEQLHRSPSTLLLNKSHRLPALQEHRAESLGPGSDFPQHTQRERFYKGAAFFKMAERRQIDERLVTSLTWSERQLYKPPLSIVRQDMKVTDQKCELVRRGAVHGESMAGIKVDPGLLLKRLFVRGEALPENRQGSRSDGGDWQEEEEGAEADNGLLQSVPSTVDSATTLPGPQEPRVYSKPTIEVAGKVFTWNEPCAEVKTEIGLQTTVGVTVKTTLRLSNLGPTVLRYSWYRDHHVDHFNTGRYRNSPFFFDSSEQVLLPRDSVSLTVQFYAEIPGRWSEFWHLYTIPKLRPAGQDDITISFWGMCTLIDHNYARREQMDDELEKLMTQKMARCCVHDIVSQLPIHATKLGDGEEDAGKWLERVSIPDDVLLFEKRNPGFFYHSQGVWKLFTLKEHQQAYDTYVKQKEITRSMTWKVAKHVVHLQKKRRKEPARGKIMLGSFTFRRANLSIVAIHRNIMTLDDKHKEEALANFNNVARDMSLSRRKPVEDTKYLVCKEAISLVFDDMSLAEWKLRRGLNMAADPLRTHPQKTPSCPRFDIDEASSSSKESLEHQTDSESLVAIMAVPEPSNVNKKKSEPFPRQVEEKKEAPAEREKLDSAVLSVYREKLYLLLHDRLAGLLQRLLPLMEHEGVELNPFLRKKKEEPF